MNIGMLWFDNDPKTPLAGKIERALDYYRGKYGKTPNLVFVHPATLAGAPPQIPGVEIRPSEEVLPNHFWIGVSKEPAYA